MSLSKAKFFLRPLTLAILMIGTSVNSFAESGLSVEQRLGRLENLMNNQALVEQSQRLEQIQQSLAELREMVENQEHQLGMIKQRQRNLYQDIDRRLNDLEIMGGQPASNSGVAPVGMAGTPAASSGRSSPIPPPGSTAMPAQGSASLIAMPVSGDKNGKSVYTQAFNTLKEGKYQQAIQAFNQFQQAYPESVYGANAQYWLGEAYSVTRDYKTALGEFQKVVSQYPQSNKVEGAMLKIGYTYYEMRDWASARASLDALIQKYPGSTVSRKAKERLQRIKREGH